MPGRQPNEAWLPLRGGALINEQKDSRIKLLKAVDSFYSVVYVRRAGPKLVGVEAVLDELRQWSTYPLRSIVSYTSEAGRRCKFHEEKWIPGQI